MKLNNWSVAVRTSSSYEAPELGSQVLQGDVSGNPGFEDATFVVTSRIIGKDPTTEAVKTKSGSLYELGTVDPQYELLYPGARERLLQSLPVVE